MSWKQVFNPETMVIWGGFRAPLYELASRGWSIEVIEEPSYQQMFYMLLRVRGQNIKGISHRIHRDEHMSSIMNSPNGYMPRILEIQMQFANEIWFENLGPTRLMHAEPIRFGMVDMRSGRLEDIIYFDDEPKEKEDRIFVEEETVPQLLAKIKEMQSPRAKELIAKQAKHKKIIIPNAQTTAKILSFKGN